MPPTEEVNSGEDAELISRIECLYGSIQTLSNKLLSLNETLTQRKERKDMPTPTPEQIQSFLRWEQQQAQQAPQAQVQQAPQAQQVPQVPQMQQMQQIPQVLDMDSLLDEKFNRASDGMVQKVLAAQKEGQSWYQSPYFVGGVVIAGGIAVGGSLYILNKRLNTLEEIAATK